MGKELDERNVRLYVFNIGLLAVVVLIREDKEAFYVDGDKIGYQPPHFNSGKSTDKKLKDHHYYPKK